MMEFASPEETALAMVVTARWLPALVRSFEKGVGDLGLTITERSHFIDQDGKACPTLGVRGQRLTFRLGLRNAMEDFLTVDREARPVRLDPRLVDAAYAKAKVADVVAGRLAILKVLDGSRDLAAAQSRINEATSSPSSAGCARRCAEPARSSARRSSCSGPSAPAPTTRSCGSARNTWRRGNALRPGHPRNELGGTSFMIDKATRRARRSRRSSSTTSSSPSRRSNKGGSPARKEDLTTACHAAYHIARHVARASTARGFEVSP